MGNTLKGDLNHTGNLHYGHFGDRYFEQLPSFPEGPGNYESYD